MKRIGLLCALWGVLSVGTAAAASSPPTVKAIVGATLIDPDRGTAVPDAVIIIEGERIKAVGPHQSTPIPAGAQLVQGAGKWVVPGLINCHVHFGLKLPGAQAAALANESPAELALRSMKNARASLLAGTTSVRSLGEQALATLAVDRAIKQGDFIGPRIFSAGAPIAPTGGHSMPADQKGADGADAVAEAVRRNHRAGASWIKLMISRGIASPSGDIAASDMTMAEMRSAVEVATRAGMKVTAHSGSAAASMEALDAGVTSIEHGYFLTEEVFKKMKVKNAWYVPTIVVSQAGAQEFFKKIGSPPWYLERAKSVGEAHWKTLQMAIRMNVNIAMGSDQFPYEPNEGTVASVREIELYAEAGMSPLNALRTATTAAATMLGAEKDIGSIAVGKYADMLLLTQDPLQDVRALRTIGFVMKGGEIVRDDWGISH